MFQEDNPERAVRVGSRRAGWALLVVTVASALGLSFLPAPYVIGQPGPTYDTLGEVTVDGSEVPLIAIEDEPAHPEFAEIRLTTVTSVGNPESLPSWFEVMSAWLSPERSVMPVEAVFPEGMTYEQTQEAARIDMENSQQEAIAAALTYLEIPYDSYLEVAATLEGGPSEGVIVQGDIVVEAAGEAIGDVTRLRELIAENGVQKPLDITVERDGVRELLQVIPRMSDGPEPVPVIGVLVSGRYDFPVQVNIQLEKVGGPSAGLAFALGLVERMTDEVIADSLNIAATGTIAADGTVGPVGGTPQKVYGAAKAGAEVMFIPLANCQDVSEPVVRGVRIVPVRSLGEAIESLELIHEDRDPPTCTNPLPTVPSVESQGYSQTGL